MDGKLKALVMSYGTTYSKLEFWVSMALSVDDYCTLDHFKVNVAALNGVIWQCKLDSR